MSIEQLTGAARLEAAAQNEVRAKAGNALPRKQVLLMGARGRLGETLLNDLLSEAAYERVHVLAQDELETGTAKLHTCRWDALAHADHVVVNLMASNRDSPGSFHGRDLVYVEMQTADIERALQWVSRIKPRSLALIAPLDAFQQFSRAASLSLGKEEFAFAGLNLPSVTIVRPLTQSSLPPDATRMQRFMALWFAQFRWILPHPNLSLRAKDVSSATLKLLQEERAGMQVVTADDMVRERDAAQTLARRANTNPFAGKAR